MEFFGITDYGPQNYIRDIMRDEYYEPMNNDEVPALMEKIFKTSTCPDYVQAGRPDYKQIRIVDCYIGRANGFAYGSCKRFIKMKQKGIIKPAGLIDMYRIAPTTSAEYGWCICDPDLTKATWYKTCPRWPMPISPNTRILDIVKKNNKYASLF